MTFCMRRQFLWFLLSYSAAGIETFANHLSLFGDEPSHFCFLTMYTNKGSAAEFRTLSIATSTCLTYQITDSLIARRFNLTALLRGYRCVPAPTLSLWFAFCGSAGNKTFWNFSCFFLDKASHFFFSHYVY